MEIARFPSHRGFSVRSIFTFVLTVVITALLWAILSSTPTHAADATWEGATIKYDGLVFTYQGKIKASDGFNIPVDSPYYTYTETFTPVGSDVMTERVRIVYFTPGTDPPKETTATTARFDYNPTSKTYSNGYSVSTISVASPGTSPAKNATSCAIDGIGWAVCPIMGFLATGMDVVFNLIADFMEVQPLQTGNTQGSLYTAWNMMRTLANVALIIVFMIIIYSQLTNVQISNYGLKRILPRLIIGAVALNLSYIICALAVDLSNVLGYELQNLFVELKNQILANGNTDNTAAILSWESVTGFVLSGGTAAAAGLIGAGAALTVVIGGNPLAAVFILLPALVGLVLVILVVLLVLAARQALIVILVIVAPLAIVAYLLPNTEKWYKKWQEILFTMLIFFPAFSVVFGGSQLAGAVIIKNATSINMIILGMIVQVAPLVITPLLLKFSGTLLGNIARLVNDPNKGVIDRTRNWSKSHADWQKQRGIGGLDRKGNPILGKDGKPLPVKGPLRKSARYLDQRKRLRTERTGNAETATQTAYENSRLYNKNDMAQQKATIEAQKDATHNRHAKHLDDARRTQGSMIYQSAMDSKTTKNLADKSESKTNRFYNTALSNERFANRVGAGALHSSGYDLEDAKLKLETSENRKTEFYQTQRAQVGTTMYASSRQLETSKLNTEAAQNRYTTVIEDLKANQTTGIGSAAKYAEASKEHLKAAQVRLETVFDTDRKTPGRILNTSTVELERAQTKGEGAKAQLAEYLSETRATQGTAMHTEYVQTEQYKQAQQVSEAKLTRIVEEYKGGGKRDAASGDLLINGNVVTPAEEALLNVMQADTARLAAEKQGATSAQYVQQANISRLMDEDSTDPLTATLLRTAAGIDENGQIRAQANAISQLEKLQRESLTNTGTLLGDRAEKRGTTIKALSKEYYAKQVGKFKDAAGNLMPREEQDPAIIEAALEALAIDGDISTLRDARLDTSAPYIDQEMLTRLFARNASNMKVKGGFDLQANPGLAGASQEKMDASTASTLGDVTAGSIAGQKHGWWEEVSGTIDRIFDNAQSYVYSSDPDEDKAARDKNIAALEKTYHNMTMALTNPNVLKDIGDRLEQTIEIHMKLHARFNDPAMEVDYDLARKGQAPPRKRT